MRIRIRKKKKEPPVPLEVEPLIESKYKVDLGNISENKVVALLRRWLEFVNSLTNEQKAQVREWACGSHSACTPEKINRWSKALKGSLDK